jgi:hypothetical protein
VPGRKHRAVTLALLPRAPLLGQRRFTLSLCASSRSQPIWAVALVDGHTVEVWAHSYEETEDAYVFSVLADVGEEQQKDLLITGRASTDAKRALVGLPRFPRGAVTKIRGGGRPAPLSD